MANGNDTQAQPPKKRSKVFLIILIALVVAGAWFGITKWHHAQLHAETDDAQVTANISPIIPRVSGYVKEVRVSDNQLVKKGDTLLILDDRDQQIKLEQAEAAMATAESNLLSAKASSAAAHSNIGTSEYATLAIDGQIEKAKVAVWQSTQEFDRYANLIKDHSVTQQQYEDKLAAKESAEKQLLILQQQKKQAASQTNAVSTQSLATASQISIAGATIKQRQVDVNDAKLNLSYTVVTAPADGRLSKVNVQVGQFLTVGQSVFSLVLDQSLWVVANYKETQYSKMRIGQPATIEVDAIPGHEFEGKVSSFAPATGATFALLPPDNASGNFVKVVQRLPVKIEFSNMSDSLLGRLKAGMNVNADVHIGN
ncbi:MAG TPA: HlyD family secretion protein [Puia sp.]|jgi:membrane fusion protein (multidrug efflux system)